MRDLLSIGTSRGCEMIGTGIGLGLSGYTLARNTFKPDQISGLQLWLDASDSTTLLQSSGGSAAVADGDPVGYWGDKSGNSRNHTQTSGTNKPALKVGVKNGKNVVRFDGVNDSLAFPITTLNQAFTIFAAVRRGGSGNLYPFIYSDNEALNYTNISDYPAGGGFRAYAGSNLYTGAIGSDTWAVVGAVFNGASSIVVKNATEASGNTGTQPLKIGRISGAGDNGASSFWDGDIAEIVIYNLALNQSQRGSVKTYMNSKWSIY